MSGFQSARVVVAACLLLWLGGFTIASEQAPNTSRPNIVLMFPDNLGWGEVNVYGGVRGAITPRLDRMAAEGLRLNNFNVEFSCTVSRAALMTGRYAVRTGASQGAGMTLWEVTIAEALHSIGYATALFGKWHLGGDHPEHRTPADQGFDEYYGVPRTSNESMTTIAQGETAPKTSYIWEGKAGSPPHNVKLFDEAARRTVDREALEKSIAFMERNVRDKKPFFVYYPMTQVHFPTLTHPDFIGKTGAGDMADAMAELDFNVGRMLDTIDKLGIGRNTIVFWCADNGAEGRRPWRGTAGPWSGFYNSVMEGGIRTPCLVRWTGHIPAGKVTNELVHEVDFFPTIAAAVGADLVPHDRAIDGLNQLPFFEGKQATSPRESVLLYANAQLRAVKWHDWKLHYVYAPEAGGPAQPPLMRLFNLLSDPKEESDIKDSNPWVQSITDRLINEFNATVQRYPHVPTGAPDPYVPKATGGR